MLFKYFFVFLVLFFLVLVQSSFFYDKNVSLNIPLVVALFLACMLKDKKEAFFYILFLSFIFWVFSGTFGFVFVLLFLILYFLALRLSLFFDFYKNIYSFLGVIFLGTVAYYFLYFSIFYIIEFLGAYNQNWVGFSVFAEQMLKEAFYNTIFAFVLYYFKNRLL